MPNITLRPGAGKLHPTEFKPGFVGTGNNTERLIGRDNNINASDRNDLLRQVSKLFEAMASNQVMSSSETKAANALSVAESRAAVLAAYRDGNGRDWQEIGAQIGTELYETANREGFARRFMMRADVVQGSIPRIPISYKTSFAWAASSMAAIQPTIVRNKYVMPPEFYIQSHLWIEEREIFQSTGDILEEKLLEGQEAVMRREDVVWKRLADRLVGQVNPLLTIVGGLTPQNLGLMRQQILQWNLPTDTLLFAADLWTDITTNTSFGSFYDPVSQYEIVQTGVIGRLLGMLLVSDAYRVPQLRVLNKGEIYLVSRPEFHGGYTDRGPVTANEINASASGHGVPARGWHMWELMSFVLHNPRSLIKAIRQ